MYLLIIAIINIDLFKDNNKYICFQSKTTIYYYYYYYYYYTYWKQVFVNRPSSGHHYAKFKTGYM
jgi:hypothetical protein